MTTPPRTAWREMPAGRELDIEIAIKLGCTVEVFPDDREGIPSEFKIFVDGRIIYRGVWRVGYDLSVCLRLAWHDRKVVRYSTDANAALTLPLDTGCWWALLPLPNGYQADLLRMKSELLATDAGELPATAMSRAWLAWREGQEK